VVYSIFTIKYSKSVTSSLHNRNLLFFKYVIKKRKNSFFLQILKGKLEKLSKMKTLKFFRDIQGKNLRHFKPDYTKYFKCQLPLLGANKSLSPTPHLSFKAVVPQRGKTNGKSWNRDIWPRFTMARAFLLPKFPCTQRGLIKTEHKPLGRLYKMFYPFFHEFLVIPSANGFQLVCYIASLFTTEAVY